MDLAVIAYLVKHPEALDDLPRLVALGEEKFNVIKNSLVEEMVKLVKLATVE